MIKFKKKEVAFSLNKMQKADTTYLSSITTEVVPSNFPTNSNGEEKICITVSMNV